MTDEQDKILKSWRCTNAKDEASVKPNYDRLCRSLFGSGINVPLDQSKSGQLYGRSADSLRLLD